MPFPFVPFPVGTVETHLHFLYDGIPGENVNGWKTTDGSPLTPGNGATIATDLFTWWNGDRAQFPSSTVFVGVTVIDLTSESGWVVNSTGSIPGTNIGVAVPNNAAMVATLQTGIRGRSYRGRNYVGGLPTSFLADQKLWTGAAVLAVDTVWDNLAGMSSLPLLQMAVLSRVDAGVRRTLGHAQGVTNIRINFPVYTLKGRLT